MATTYIFSLQIGLNLLEVGINFAVLSASYVLFAIIAGQLSDKYVSFS